MASLRPQQPEDHPKGSRPRLAKPLASSNLPWCPGLPEASSTFDQPLRGHAVLAEKLARVPGDRVFGMLNALLPEPKREASQPPSWMGGRRVPAERTNPAELQNAPIGPCGRRHLCWARAFGLRVNRLPGMDSKGHEGAWFGGGPGRLAPRAREWVGHLTETGSRLCVLRVPSGSFGAPNAGCQGRGWDAEPHGAQEGQSMHSQPNERYRHTPTRFGPLLGALASLLLGAGTGLADPPTVGQPIALDLGAPSVSLGADVVLRTAEPLGTPPFTYQWRRNGKDIAGATDTTLRLTTVQSSDAGEYTMFLKDAVGEATSPPLTLTVDTTFRNVVVLPGKNMFTGEWVDVNGDGWLDLLGAIAEYGPKPPYTWTVLLNSRDGAFVSVCDTAFSNVGAFYDRGYGDYDNDGQTDALISTDTTGPVQLYHNLGAASSSGSGRVPHRTCPAQSGRIPRQRWLPGLRSTRPMGHRPSAS